MGMGGAVCCCARQQIFWGDGYILRDNSTPLPEAITTHTQTHTHTHIKIVEAAVLRDNSNVYMF